MERATATNLAIARLTPLLAVLRWDGVGMKTFKRTADHRLMTAKNRGGLPSAVGGR
ncbi:MAG: hypothetical protein L6R45_25070 [Anaerolineae bacterium]|nr:hypothetical protein [Anaerolineae bacterium]